MKNPLNDQNFLKKLFQNNNRKTYIKIISFNFDNEPIEKLEGVISNGSINLDGKSAVRRSCTLTMLADVTTNNISKQNWFMSTKIKIYIGIQNSVLEYQSIYPEIIWFPMGWYYISSFNYSQSTTHYTINLSAKDKMSMLNGELGGTFTALTTDLGQEEYMDTNGKITLIKRKIKDIVRDLVHTYGKEPYQNIIINDLDILGSELLEYRGEEPIYLFKNRNNNEIVLWTTDSDYIVAKTDNSEIFLPISDNAISYEKINYIEYNTIAPDIVYLTRTDNNTGIREAITDNEYTVVKIDYGEVAGYRPTELTYAGDLVANLGETVVSVLDKIKNMLGAYEYFYNEDGQFVFQKKISELQTTFNNLRQDSISGIQYIEPLAYSQNEAYVFDGFHNITTFSNNININVLKNDYSVWGTRNNHPIHMRYSIKQKPSLYKTYNGVEYSNSDYDWRELLYQMAEDDKKRTKRCNQCNNCLIKFDLSMKKCPECGGANITSNILEFPDFRERLMENNEFCKNGYTGYEEYYSDMLGFWRTLYNPWPEPLYEQISYAASKEEYPERYVDKLILLNNSNNIKNRDQLYVIKNNELHKWIDTIDFTKLIIEDTSSQIISISNTPLTNNALDNIYYYKNGNITKIIDSIDYDIANLFVATDKNGYQPLYKFLTNDIIDQVYVSETKYGFKQPYHNFYTVSEYNNKNVQFPFFDNQMYLKKVMDDANKTIQYFPIYEIALNLPNNNTACLWQYYPNTTLTKEMANTIAAAIKNYPSSLTLAVEGQSDTYIFNANNGDAICLNTLLNADQCFLWYKETTDNNYIPLQDRVLVYTPTTEPNKFNKYELYQFIEQDYINTIDAINIDKSASYWKFIDDSGNVVFARVLDQLKIILNEQNIYELLDTKIKTDNIASQLKFLYQTSSNNYIKNFVKTPLNIRGNNNVISLKQIETLIKYYHQYYEYKLSPDNKDYTQCWKESLYNDFTSANFWIDFLDTESNLCHFSVDRIGTRTKTENNNTTTAINFGDIPAFQWINEEDWNNKEHMSGYTYIKIPATLYDYFVVSAQGKSCKDTIDTWLSEYAKINSTITFGCVPIYCLQPNSLIVVDQHEYEISKITIPLQYNGLMNIQATQILRQNF